MCDNYEEIPFQANNEELSYSIEDLEDQSEQQRIQMQSIVQSHDDLRMENYQLKERLNEVEESLEMMREKYEDLSEQMSSVLRSIEKLKSKTDDDDEEESESEERRCGGFSSYESCYELTDDKLTYNAARAYCKREGGMLATWSSDMSVHRQLLDHAMEQDISASEYIWIGASYDSKTEQSLWADGREVDIKITRFTKQTSCGAIFKRYIAGFKCGNEYRAWCQFGNATEM